MRQSTDPLEITFLIDLEFPAGRSELEGLDESVHAEYRIGLPRARQPGGAFSMLFVVKVSVLPSLRRWRADASPWTGYLVLQAQADSPADEFPRFQLVNHLRLPFVEQFKRSFAAIVVPDRSGFDAESLAVELSEAFVFARGKRARNSKIGELWLERFVFCVRPGCV